MFVSIYGNYDKILETGSLKTTGFHLSAKAAADSVFSEGWFLAVSSLLPHMAEGSANSQLLFLEVMFEFPKALCPVTRFTGQVRLTGARFYLWLLFIMPWLSLDHL